MKFLVLALAACHAVPAIQSAGVDELTSERVRASTFKIITPTMASGTAWVYQDDKVVTAGHICDEGPGDFVLISYTGIKSLAHPIKWANDDDTMMDICLMEAPGVRDGLPVLGMMPMVGEAVGYVGYPLGKYKESTGRYVGDVDGPDMYDDYTATVDCDHGASGSAMYTRYGVYGVLVRLIVMKAEDGYHVLPGADGCVASPVSQLEKL